MSSSSGSRGVKVEGSVNHGVIVTGDHNAVTFHAYGANAPTIDATIAVFLNYRRDDSQHITARIHDRLRQALGADRVFKDVIKNPNSVGTINETRLKLQEILGNCQVLIAVIGRQWLSMADEAGRRLIDDEADVIRLEIETALSRGVRVIMVLVEGALSPRPADLPGCLEGMTNVQKVSVRDEHDFHNDVDRLIALVQLEAGSQRGTVPLIEQVAAIYELLQYDVERHKVIAGRTVDLFLQGKHGDLEVHRVIGCFPNHFTRDDLNRFTDLVRAVNREYRQVLGTIITALSVTTDVAALAHLHDINLITFTELSSKLLDGRTYANGLRLRCGETEMYPTRLYVVPLIGETVQGNERPAFTGLVGPAGSVAAPRDDTLGVIELWLADPKANQLTLLGDVGTGKTFLMRVLASELARRYLEKPATQPLPLLIDLRDTDREVSLEGLVLTHLQGQGMRQITFPIFDHAVRNGQIILLFDGFDEMAARTSPQVTRRNFQQLARCAKGKAKLLITCRTHYFTSRTEEEEVVLGSTLESDSSVAQELLRDLIDGQNCHIAYLRPFQLTQIREYVELARPKDAAACIKKIEGVYNLPELCQRPMLLQMIVKSIDRLGSREINPARLYEVFTEVWINRDTWRAILPRDLKLQFVTALARVFWQEGISWIHYSTLLNHVKSEFAAEIQDPRRLVEIDSEVRTATFLTRDDQGHYGFAHKSYAEYFLARELARQLNSGNIECLNTKPLTPEVLTFLSDLIDVEQVDPALEARLTGEYVSLVSENCLLTLYGIRRHFLLSEAREMERQSEDLVISLPNQMVLPNAKLSSINLEGAVLRGAILDGADLSLSSLSYCDLTGASLTGSNLEQSNLSHATIRDTNCSRANLRNSNWLQVNANENFRAVGADWTHAKVARDLARLVGLSTTSIDGQHDIFLDQKFFQEIQSFCWEYTRFARQRVDRNYNADDLFSRIASDVMLRKSKFVELKDSGMLKRYVHTMCANIIHRTERTDRFVILETDLGWSLEEVAVSYDNIPVLLDSFGERIELLLNELPISERQIITMRYLNDMSINQIAHRLKISIAAVSQRTKRALYQLREIAEKKSDLFD